MHDISTIPATRNEDWGFWGALSTQAEAAWPLAVAAIAERTGSSFEGARDFLDGTQGRHFADVVRDRLQAGDDLAAAVHWTTARWRSWTGDCRR